MTADQLAALLGREWALQPQPAGLARRLALTLRHLIAGELLATGTRLPPERVLAQALHVSRPTVTSALDELRGLGLLESRQGSGTWVAGQPERAPAVPAMSELVLAGHGINLAAATPADASHLGPLRLGSGDLLGGGAGARPRPARARGAAHGDRGAPRRPGARHDGHLGRPRGARAARRGTRPAGRPRRPRGAHLRWHARPARGRPRTPGRHPARRPRCRSRGVGPRTAARGAAARLPPPRRARPDRHGHVAVAPGRAWRRPRPPWGPHRRRRHARGPHAHRPGAPHAVPGAGRGPRRIPVEVRMGGAADRMAAGVGRRPRRRAAPPRPGGPRRTGRRPAARPAGRGRARTRCSPTGSRP